MNNSVSEADIRFELCYLLRLAKIDFAQEFVVESLAMNKKSSRLDVVVLFQRKIVCIIEVKSDRVRMKEFAAKEERIEKEQLDRYKSLGYPLFVCRGMRQVRPCFNSIQRVLEQLQ